MRKSILIALCLVLFLGCLAGCSTAQDDSYGEISGNAGNVGNQLSGSSIGDAESNVTDNRKIIRKITMSAETEDMDELLSNLNTRIGSLGGYIESRNIINGSAYATGYVRTATLVIRIPAQSLDAFLVQVEEYSNVISTVEKSDDVTMEYVDTESRLKVLRTEEERLLQFLSEAASITQMLEIEQRLTEVQTQIESLIAQLNTYDDLVAYGTVTLSITEVEVYTPLEQEKPTMWEEIQDGFMASLNGLLSVGRVLVVFLLSASPWLVVLGLIGLGIWLFIRAYDRRQRRKRSSQNKT